MRVHVAGAAAATTSATTPPPQGHARPPGWARPSRGTPGPGTGRICSVVSRRCRHVRPSLVRPHGASAAAASHDPPHLSTLASSMSRPFLTLIKYSVCPLPRSALQTSCPDTSSARLMLSLRIFNCFCVSPPSSPHRGIFPFLFPVFPYQTVIIHFSFFS